MIANQNPRDPHGAHTREGGAIGDTTAMRIAAELRRRILTGQIAPGDRLKIDEIAADCNVSHMPVRAAFQKLEVDGVLDLIPHRGAVIRSVDADFVRNLYDVRAAIEGMLAEGCAARVDATGLERLEAAVAAFESAAAGERDTAAMLAANQRFHDTVNEIPANPLAVHMLTHGRLLVESLRLRFGYNEQRLDRVLTEHRAIFHAIAKHDVESAGRLARIHAVGARDDILGWLAALDGERARNV